MAIISTPTKHQADEPHSCVICGRAMPHNELTAGLMDAAGKQQFACYGHSWDGSKFILGWAAFGIEQRRILTEAALQLEYAGGPHGRHIR